MSKLRVVASVAVTQNELDAIAALTCQIAALRSIQSQHCQKVLDRILDGAPVEPGRHTADFHKEDCGLSRMYHLIVDGQRIR